ncbi:MAG: iron-containing alcohol dehydrogenase, partial [Lachnospiraceae bacterium]|nr:iron-containing alcohol dehydrogenase [Lachnospiraceae bacterium]
MNLVKKAYCRCFQMALRIALPFLPYRNPEILNHMEDIPYILKKNHIKKPLVITDSNLSKLGATERLQQILKSRKVAFAFYDKAFSNPTTDLAKEAAEYYREQNCDGLIAYGGGSPMDLAKAVGVCVVRPKKSLKKMAGILKVHHRLPLFIAIPTTAGTGSETTLAAVLVDTETRHKFAINDFPLIPGYAVLDPETIHTLPVEIAATTGLDALTHAIEAYIGRSTTRQTRKDAKKAVSLIFENFDRAVRHEDKKAETYMLRASYYAGRAFTRSYVGYIHA